MDSSQMVSELRRALAMFILSMALFSVLILTQLLVEEEQAAMELASASTTPGATSLSSETNSDTPTPGMSLAMYYLPTPGPQMPVESPDIENAPMNIAGLEPIAPGELCVPQTYLGIRQCTLGDFQILRLDPKAPFLHIRTVLPMGYDRDGIYAECSDLLVPDSVPGGSSSGPGCHINGYYPGERIEEMASRYPNSAAAFNGDFFSSKYAHGAMGLTVREGLRLDGGPQDQDGRDVRRSSLSISSEGEVRIGVVPAEIVPEGVPSWSWIPNPDDFFTTVGGLPMLVSNGQVVDIRAQCDIEEGWCADPFLNRARTAVGKTKQGELLVVVLPEDPGISLEGLAEVMLSLGAWDALNLDGGGSSQLWYDGSYLVYSSRPVAEGLIVQAVPLHQWKQQNTDSIQ